MNRFKTLFLTGFLLILAGLATLFSVLLSEGKVAGGGAFVVFIGPFPLVVGFGEYPLILILLGIVITALMIIALLVIRRQSYK